MNQKMLTVNGFTVSVAERTVAGKPHVVCLHGLQSNKRVFEAMLDRQFFADFSSIGIDCVGFGASEKPEAFSYDLSEQAEIVARILDELNVRKCHLIGHSMGGMIGTMLLAQMRSRVSSFVNMEGNLVLADCGKSAEVVTMPLKKFEQEGYAALKDQLSRSSEKSAPYRLSYLEETPAYAFYKTSVSIVEWSKSEKLLSLFNDASQKRMFMYGSDNAPKALHVSSGVQKAEIPVAGHFMMLDNPEQTYDRIEEFISGKL